MAVGNTPSQELGSPAKRARTDERPHSHADSGQELGILAEMDEEITAPSRSLHAAKKRRNNATLCHKLPPEIISKVLRYLANMCPINVDLKSHQREHYGYWGCTTKTLDPPRLDIVNRLAWINFLHTCQYFREVGLGDASLWTNIKLGELRRCMPERWVPAFLSRSKSTKLDVSVVFCECHGSPGERFKEAMDNPSHAARVRTLFISERYFEDPDTYSLREGFSSLRHKILESLRALTIEWRSIRRNSIPVGRKFQAPHLSKLCIRGAIPPPSLPIYANLLHLELETFEELSSTAGDKLVSILSQTKQLQFFALRDPVIRDFDPGRWEMLGVRARDNRVPLLKDLPPLVLPPSLKRFQLDLLDGASCPIALETVVPPQAAVDISVQRFFPSTGYRELATRYGCFSSAHPLRRAFIDEDDVIQFEVRPEDDDPLARRSFTIDGAGLNWNWDTMIPELDLSAVRELYFGHEAREYEKKDKKVTVMAWDMLFPHAHEVQHLVIPYMRVDSLLSALVPPVHSGAEDPDAIAVDGNSTNDAPVGTIFPALRQLTLTVNVNEAHAEGYKLPDMDTIKAALKEKGDIEVVFEPDKSVADLWDDREGGARVEDDIFSLGEDGLVVRDEW